MPYRTKSGSHYHMTKGCHRATIPCGTEGLTPCTTCCGSGGSKDGGRDNAGIIGGGTTPGALGRSIPAGTTVIHGRGREVSLDGTVIETRAIGAGISTTQDGVLYRLDSKLSDDKAEALKAMPGVRFMPDEYSLDTMERTSAFVISEMGPKYSVDYAATISDLGLHALGKGHESPSDIDTKSISAWLASNRENEWKTIRAHGVRLVDGAEPIHADPVYSDYDALDPNPPRVQFPARTLYEITREPYQLDYLVTQDILRTEGLGLSTYKGKKYLSVDDGYEVVAREEGDGTRLGVRKHYDTQIMRDVNEAKWEDSPDRRLPKGTKQAKGVAYRTPAGDAIIRMTVMPNRNAPGETRTTIRIDDPMLGSPITLAQDLQSGSFDYAVKAVCSRCLADANIGARGGKVRKEYERALPRLARKKCEEEGIEVRQVLRNGNGTLDIIGDEAGYVPVRLQMMLNDDGTIETYHR